MNTLEILRRESQSRDQDTRRVLSRLGRLGSRNGVLLNGAEERLVTSDQPVNSAVYLNRGLGGAAIRVDVANDPALSAMYDRLTPAFIRINMSETRHAGLRGLASLVAHLFPYDSAAVDEINRQDGYLFADKQHQRIRSLGEFTTASVCTHQALAVTALLEVAQRDGQISGRVSFATTRSQQIGPHAYSIYEQDDRQWIVDPATGRRDMYVASVDDERRMERYMPAV